MKLKKLLLFFIFILLIPLSACSKITKKKYDVTDDYFEYNSFRISRLVTASTRNNVVANGDNSNNSNSATNDEYMMSITAFCSWSLCEEGCTAMCYNALGGYLGTLTFEKTYSVDKNSTFRLDKTFSDSNLTNTATLRVTFYGKSYEKPTNEGRKLTVTFINNNDSQNLTKEVKYGETVSKPVNPTKDKYNFSIWCIDKELKTEYDFSNKVTRNMTLYAKYTLDYMTITNDTNETAMKSNVTVRAKSYNSVLGIETSSITSQGSGVIVASSESYYWVLTNDHVAKKKSGYDSVKYTIEDYLGNTYTGTLKNTDSNYDLALIYFKKGSAKLNILKVGKQNSTVGDDVIAIGQPKSQKNTISFGVIESYINAPVMDNGSKLNFQVIRHNAKIDNGSSGGALINVDQVLIGLNYGGSEKDDGSYVCSYAIPAVKIREYMSNYVTFKD